MHDYRSAQVQLKGRRDKPKEVAKTNKIACFRRKFKLWLIFLNVHLKHHFIDSIHSTLYTHQNAQIKSRERYPHYLKLTATSESDQGKSDSLRVSVTAHVQRDPKGYREEFLTQYNHYLSLYRVYALGQSSSTTNDKNEDLFEELITFICQVAQCYPEETKDLTGQLKALLLGEGGNGGVAKGEVRRTIVKNLVMLRNKDVIDSVE